MVFIEHGLRVGIFIAITLFAAVALWRASDGAEPEAERPRKRVGPAVGQKKFILYAGWLFVILYLSKTLGAFMISLLLLPALLFFKARTQVLMAACLAGMVLLYPTLRQTSLIPLDAVYSIAQSVDESRADSFRFRLDNEDILLSRAAEKPLFGWGGWGRSRVYDPISGRDISVTDGSWVIAFGTSGWLGYLAQFGLLALPLFLALRRRHELDVATSGLCLILAANLLDLIPNSSLTPLTWLYAGTLLGYMERTERSPRDERATMRRRETLRSRTSADPLKRSSGYRRT